MGGRYYEDLAAGQLYRHEPGRTITEFDNVLFSALTMNPQPLHVDAEFAAGTEFGERIVNSLFTLGLMVGLSVTDLTLGTTVANLGFQAVEFPAPVRHGDTVRAETTVLECRDSRSRPGAGVVTFEHRAYRQDGVLVARCRRGALMHKRGTLP